jgi:hypothetical protein
VINFVAMATIVTDASGNDLITTGVKDHKWGKPPIVEFCVTNQQPEASAPVVYGLVLSTPAHAVDRLAADLTRYRRRTGTRRRTNPTRTQGDPDRRLAQRRPYPPIPLKFRGQAAFTVLVTAVWSFKSGVV